MAKNYLCNLCEKSCYLKNLKNCDPYGYICKDCRVKLGLEEYEKYVAPEWMKNEE